MPLRLVIFDFDQTLSAYHVYNTLAGGQDTRWRLPPPHARSEVGQLALIAELDQRPEISRQGGFANAAFGGPQRVAQVKALLEHLRQGGVECIICSRGLVGPVRKILDQLGLLRYFSQVFANIGETYGRTDYDKRQSVTTLGTNARYLGSSENSGWGSKARLVGHALASRRLSGEQAVFIDDQSSEIQSMHGVCQTIQVMPPQGLGPREVEALLQRLSSEPDKSVATPSFTPAVAKATTRTNQAPQTSSRLVDVTMNPGTLPPVRGAGLPASSLEHPMMTGMPTQGNLQGSRDQQSFLMPVASPLAGPVQSEPADDRSFVRPVQNVWSGISPPPEKLKKSKDEVRNGGRSAKSILCCQQ
eukprot:TRINITY_DN77414_c0_g1_i1.p1 TRINITY_DN77414_c0_g1~~TRINITY_DN77414_c0_g1_i1.p1  ORF type:complete len:359 (+),score=63.23 TRINITY_DN77414_c0_g1_i1:99-1175(+)